MVSLRAVNEWIGVINSNLGGSNRTAYKATRVSFGGGVAQIERDPRQEANGVQIPDSTLTIQNTRIDFSQGTIIQDGELTHLGISGDGFFAVTTAGPGTFTSGTLLDTRNDIFYTRDGEFRWTVFKGPSVTKTVLTTAGGLTVLASDGQAITRIGSGSTFSLTITKMSGAETSTNPVDAVTPGESEASVGVFRFPNNQALKFSKFGSTVFDNAQAGQGSQITDVELIQSSLESSNAALNDTLPELSLAQKLFSAVSKIINVANSDLDVVVNLIR
ncbi:MAG: flagellar hook basal-body protein [Candidatus Sericytochromatia bacterium]|nr:flagellar hook basal-body protein [Candidatus Sericytochromatia bacterium]